MDFWTLWEKVRVGWFERTALKHVYYHMWNRWPVQVWYMKQGTQSRCTGTTQRDGMGREVGGGFRMGDTCTPMADSCRFNSVAQLCLILCDPMNAACQASLSITNSWSLLKLMSIESMMPSNNHTLSNPLLRLPSIIPSIKVFSNESTLHMRWPKY